MVLGSLRIVQIGAGRYPVSYRRRVLDRPLNEKSHPKAAQQIKNPGHSFEAGAYRLAARLSETRAR